LRYSLMPYLYSAAHAGHRTSMPILRPMPLAFPDEVKLADNLSQYMLGDSLLVAAFTDHVQLPTGRWIDYWSGKEYSGPLEMTAVYPADRAGALFIKAGAIIPYWPEMDFVGEKPVEMIRIEVYPEGKSVFTLYEDDGNTLDYLKGAVAETAIQCQAAKDHVQLTIAPRAGSYQGMPSQRNYDIRIHAAKPKSVTLNGIKAEWTYQSATGCVGLAAIEDPSRKTPIVVEVGM
jgi:alpha-glucosidase